MSRFRIPFPLHFNIMKIQAIIFDLDGTLIDSMGLWRQVDTDFLNQRGIAVPDDLFDQIPAGNSFINTAQYFKDRFDLDDSVDEIMQQWTEMVRNHYSNGVTLKAGARELLEYLLQHGIKIGLGTSNSLELATLVLSNHKVWHYFQTAVTGCMQLKGKPFPDIYLHAAQDIGVEPSECLVIEDTYSGVMAGNNAGMRVIAIYDDDSRPDWTRIEQVTEGMFHDFFEIKDYLSSLLDTP